MAVFRRNRRSSTNIRRNRILRYGAAAAVALLAVAGCSSGTSDSGGKNETLTIALQPDLGYTPLYIVKQEDWLAKALPGVHVEWQTLNSGSAIETGMISHRIDVGAGGVAPFLLGVDSKVGWKLLASLDEMNLELVAQKGINSLHDFKSSDRIAVVAPTSIQSIILKKAAQVKLGNAHALDQNMAILPHATAYQAFASHSIAAALDAPPFQQKEVAAGGHVLVGSYQFFGKSTFDSTFALASFYQSHTSEMKTLVAQIQRAVTMLNSDPDQAAKVISAYENGSLSVADAHKEISDPGTTWTITPHGYLAYGKFMHSIGILKRAPQSMSQIELSTLAGNVGN